MSIRAYKLAEELGIERHEFVEKAAELGVELKSAMTTLDEAQADDLREKLGKPKQIVVEKRVVGAGGAVLRRRRKKKVEPEPAPEPVAPAEEAPAAAPEVEPIPEPVTAEEAQPEPVAEAEPSEPEPAPEPTPSVEDAGRPAEQPAVAPEPAAPVGERKKQRKRVREVVNLQEQEQLARQSVGRAAPRRTTTVDPRSMTSPRRRRRDAPAAKARAEAAPAAPVEQKKVIRVEGDVTVGELAKLLGAKAAEIQGKLMALGTMVSINQPVDVDTARKVAAGLGFEVEDVGFKEEEFFEEPAAEVAPEKLQPRPPIVTVMGHVDHGKTSLLDAIRKTNVVKGEAGGITQHIGAYQAKAGKATLTFIDTPGHAAFTTMRARGAEATDIVVLVVAATEGIMPQTIEAINHAQAAGCPIIVAVNKMDLPGADSPQTRQRLMEHGLVPEDFGGDVQCVDVSAVKGTGIDALLEAIALQSEILELKADPDRRAVGVVLEAELDRGRGPVATVLVQEGTLHRGDIIVVGTHWGRVRAMQNERGQRTNEAGPSVPVQVIGLSGVPEAGSSVHAVESERVAKQIVDHRESQRRGRAAEPAPRRMSLDELFAQAEEGGTKELNVVLKADVHGSCEAVRESLEKLSTDRVKLNVILAGVGGITESDVMLAVASNAIVLGFHVRPDSVARKIAESQGVDLRVYQVIYELLDEVKAAMAGLLPPTIKENFLGRAEVRQIFTIPRIGTIAGSYITEGLMRRNAQCRLIRDGVQIYEGQLGSLRRFKDDVREVQTGFECGIGIEGYNDVKVGDVIEAFSLEEEAATL